MGKIFTIYFLLSFLVVVSVFLILLNLGYILIYIEKPVMQIIADMDNQNKISKDNIVNLWNPKDINNLPLKTNFPINSIFYQFEPYEYSVPETTFVNPVPLNEINFERGRTIYYRFCLPCHNYDGKGNGLITTVPLQQEEEGFPQPKDLTSEGTKKLTDGRLFHILSAGQNLMFSYHDKLSDYDKWCLIHYIRYLQKKNK